MLNEWQSWDDNVLHLDDDIDFDVKLHWIYRGIDSEILLPIGCVHYSNVGMRPLFMKWRMRASLSFCVGCWRCLLSAVCCFLFVLCAGVVVMECCNKSYIKPMSDMWSCSRQWLDIDNRFKWEVWFDSGLVWSTVRLVSWSATMDCSCWGEMSWLSDV